MGLTLSPPPLSPGTRHMAMRPGQTSRSRRGERVVQLAPACLAIVLGRESEPEGERMAAAGQAREPWPSGYQLFADFKAANASRFWDTRVSAGVRAARLAGWLHGGALLVRGERAQLDALRDAWGRRALRPPSGFTIRHVGKSRLLDRTASATERRSQIGPCDRVECNFPSKQVFLGPFSVEVMDACENLRVVTPALVSV